MYQFKLPDIGEGTHEADIIAWHVKVGDHVKEDDTLVEIQSDKATADLPSPVDGIVTKIIGEEGDKALVGSVIIEIDTGDGEAAPAGDSDVAADESGVDAIKEADEETDAAPVADAPATGASEVAAPAGDRPAVHGEDVDIRTLAVPRVRYFARQHGIDLRTISGTGRSGLITMEDVEAALSGAPAAAAPVPAAEPAAPAASEAPAAPAAPAAPEPAAALAAPAPVAPQAGERREKMSPVRKATANAMVAAKQTVPHVTVFDRAVVDELMAHRARLKPRAAESGIKLTYTPYLVKAAVAMLKRHADLNAYADMASYEIVHKDSIDVSVAINTEHGLFVPVIKDADRLSLFDIAREVDRLSELAMAGKLTSADMRGGSLTITNVGGAATAGVWSTPIINVPEAVIIGIGRIEGEFLPDEDKNPVYHDVMKISFGFDHRLVDGVAAQLALNDFKAFLSDPDYLFAES